MRAGARLTAAAVAGRRAARPRPRRPPPLLLLLLLPSLVLSSTLARSQPQPGQQEHEEERRGELTEEGVAELVERFFAKAAALGGDEGDDDDPAQPPPALDPSVESLLARLLDEVLPDDAAESLRARTAAAMGVRAPPRTTPTTPDDDNTTTDQSPPDPLRARTPDNTTTPRRRRTLLQNATPLSPIIAPASFLTVDRGGRFGGWAQSFQLAFSNIFDFFLRGGLGFLVPIIGDSLAPLRRYNWVRDTGMAIDAPVDNVINANYFPLPQTTDDLLALALRILAPFCAAERAVAGYQVLGALTGAVAELELVPWSCDVVPVSADDAAKEKKTLFENLLAAKHKKHDDDENAPPSSTLGARQKIAWDTCVPSRLVLRLKPATFSGPYFSAASYRAASCAFAQPFGVGSTFTLGLDAAAIALKLSRVGVDITPTIVQFEGSGRFFPWIAAEIANNSTAGPAREVAFTSAANRTTGS
jgi:hypothetical protein